MERVQYWTPVWWKAAGIEIERPVRKLRVPKAVVKLLYFTAALAPVILVSACTDEPDPAATRTPTPTTTASSSPIPTPLPISPKVSLIAEYMDISSEELRGAGREALQVHLIAENIGDTIVGNYRLHPTFCWDNGEVISSLEPPEFARVTHRSENVWSFYHEWGTRYEGTPEVRYADRPTMDPCPGGCGGLSLGEFVVQTQICELFIVPEAPGAGVRQVDISQCVWTHSLQAGRSACGEPPRQ